MSIDTVRTLIVSVNKAGHINQCKALCAAMGWTADELLLVPGWSRSQPLLQRLTATYRNATASRAAAPRRREFDRLRIVASGRGTEALVAAYRALYRDGLVAVFIGAPRTVDPTFDISVVSRHAVPDGTLETPDYFSGSRQTFWMTGVPVQAFPGKTSAVDSKSPTVLVGGINKAFSLDPDSLAEQLSKLVAPPGSSKTATVVFSRRTPPQLETRLRTRLPSDRFDFVDRNDRSGFARALLSASAYVLTPDSITMLCEACGSGRPVGVLDCRSTKPDTDTARFLTSMLRERYVVPIDSAQPETKRWDGLAEIRHPILAYLAQRGWNERAAAQP